MSLSLGRILSETRAGGSAPGFVTFAPGAEHTALVPGCASTVSTQTSAGHQTRVLA